MLQGYYFREIVPRTVTTYIATAFALTGLDSIFSADRKYYVRDDDKA
jgi:hypothetical protein